MRPRQPYPLRLLSLTIWCMAVWILLTWTLTLEFMLVGLAVSVAIGVALAPMGDVPRPWRMLHPRWLFCAVVLLLDGLRRIVRANLSLTRRIWLPSRPLSSGMVIVPTRERGETGLTAVGLITSLIVDNQIVDVDSGRHELQYHAVEVPKGGRQDAYDTINGPVERLLAPLQGPSDG